MKYDEICLLVSCFRLYFEKFIMSDQNNIQKIENEKKINIKKTIDYPINDALKWWELKDAISLQKKNRGFVPVNQITISLDKYENRIIKKRKA